jgi:hypothetical protein
METWILARIRAVATYRVFAWSLAFAVMLLMLLTHTRYIHNFISGPFEVGADDLVGISSLDHFPKPFAHIRGTRVVDTGIQQITVHTTNGVETSREVSGHYYALQVGDRFLLVKSDGGLRQDFTGELTYIPQDLESKVFDSAGMSSKRGEFYPYYLDTDSYRTAGWIGIVVLFLFTGYFFHIIGPAWRHMRDPASHPLAGRVAGWGDAVAIAAQAQREFKAAVFKMGSWKFTENFAIRSSFFHFNLVRCDELQWAYKKVTKHSVNFIPTGKTFGAVLCYLGGNAEVQGKEQQVDAALQLAAQKAPWAVFGHSDELDKTWRKKNGQFLAAVDQRRKQWLQQQAAKKPAAAARA